MNKVYTSNKINGNDVNQLISGASMIEKSEKKKRPKCHRRMNHLTRHLWEAAASQLYVPSVREKGHWKLKSIEHTLKVAGEERSRSEGRSRAREEVEKAMS